MAGIWPAPLLCSMHTASRYWASERCGSLSPSHVSLQSAEHFDRRLQASLTNLAGEIKASVAAAAEIQVLQRAMMMAQFPDGVGNFSHERRNTTSSLCETEWSNSYVMDILETFRGGELD